ncbi:hypothetical protein NHX12_004643, partial [Muraenolepis orangiensis]
MDPDGPHRFPRAGGPWQRAPDPRRYGTPAHVRDHPGPPGDRRDLGGGGRDLWADGAQSHRSPQRRPVFAAGPGPYPVPPGHFSPGHRDPWDPRPAQRTHGARGHCSSVREQCGCVWVVGGSSGSSGSGGGGGGARPFNGASRHTFFNGGPLPPPEFRGQGDGRRRTPDGGLGEEEDEEDNEEGSGEEGDGRRAARERERRRRLEPRAPPSYLHVSNGHSGRRGGREAGSRRPDRSWRSKLLSEEEEEVEELEELEELEEEEEEGRAGYSGAPGVSRGGFFSTEVPQKHLNHGRRKGPRLAPPAPPGEPAVPAAPDPPPPGGGAAPGATVHEQIRQVVRNLEDVLGGLKQVHVEMKEVVDQIDRLTANMDLGDESLNHVFLRTNAPSPVHMASVVKTNRVPPPWGATKEAGRRQQRPPQQP